MYGKIKRNFIKIFSKLGVLSNSLQNTFYNTPNDFSNKNITTFSLKVTLVILSTLIILFILPNFSNAYSLNDYENLSNITFKDISELDLSVSSNMSNIIQDDNYNKIVFNTILNNESYTILIAFNKSSPFILYDKSYAAAYTNNVNFLFGSTSSYRAADIIKDYYGTSLGSTSTAAKKSVTINDVIYYYNGIVFNNSYGLFDIENNVVYTNMTNFDFVYNDNVYNIDLISTPEIPEEPTNESVDLSFTNNLLFYLCFIMTLNTLYTMIRNIFSKEW